MKTMVLWGKIIATVILETGCFDIRDSAVMFSSGIYVVEKCSVAVNLFSSLRYFRPMFIVLLCCDFRKDIFSSYYSE